MLWDLRDALLLTAGPAVHVDVILGDDLPVVLCERLGLEATILELVANARNAMADGGHVVIEADVDVGSVNLESRRSDVILSIRDAGEGMTNETLRRALLPFFTTKPMGSGTGLGLSAVREFVLLSRGSMEIETEPGVGTSITLRLPSRTD